ncbi:unnamed protein product, partial [Meganyctiphanes norvegica]
VRRSPQSDLLRIELYLIGYPMYHGFATFVPTILLHLLSFATLLINAQNFSDRGSMSLTTLLVLIALYVETLSSLPRTPYLKSLDVWFGFSVTFLTLIIAVHVATNGATYNVNKFNDKWTTERVLKWARWILALIYIAFQITFWFMIINSNLYEKSV